MLARSSADVNRNNEISAALCGFTPAEDPVVLPIALLLN